MGSLVAAAASDVGRVRAANEDAFTLLPEQGLFIVSDGMGGHLGGSAASAAVVSVLPGLIVQRLAEAAADTPEAVADALRDAIVDLSQRLRERAADHVSLTGMGATVALALLRGDRAFIAHMGDSRAYLYRGGELARLTDDHSVVGLLLRHGEITSEEARTHPARGQLSRYVGMEGVVYPDVRVVPLSPGDRLLLCTDGLTGMVGDAGLAEVLAGRRDPDLACRALVDAANALGGKDNVTVVLVGWEGEGHHLRGE